MGRHATILPRFYSCVLFGLIYLSAFASFGVQALGLIGSPRHPAGRKMGRCHPAARPAAERFYLMPMLFWISSSDPCHSGGVLGRRGILVAVGFSMYCRASACFLLYVLYLSLLYGGQTFMSYQWDTFFCWRPVFLTLLMSLARAPGIWLLRWLLFSASCSCRAWSSC